MVEIEILNFQSIEHVKFRIDGFTVLVGKSNIGKSAVIRAIQCALTGAAGTDFVRHGPGCDRRSRGVKKCKCHSEVRIRTSKIDLTWKKGDAINRYAVLLPGEKESKVYDKIGQGTPEFLQPEFSPVKVGSGPPELVQVSEQFDPIFLLNQSGNVVADVLSDVAHLDQINSAMGLVSKDRKSHMTTRKVREKDILALNKSLGAYEGLDDALDDVARAEQDYAAIQGASDALDKLEGFRVRASALWESLRALKAAVTPPEPDGEALEEVSRKAVRASALYDTLKTKAILIRRLRGVGEITLPNKSALEETLGRASQMASWLQRLRDFKVRLGRWKSLGAYKLPDPEPLKAALNKATEVQGFLSRLVTHGATLKQVEVDLKTAETQEQTLLEEIQALGICPTCSQDIDAHRCLHLGDT
jgi:AAA domain